MPIGINSPKPCPSCGTSMAQDDVLCVACGFDKRRQERRAVDSPRTRAKAQQHRWVMFAIVGAGILFIFAFVKYIDHRNRLAEREGVLLAVRDLKSEGDELISGQQYAKAKAEYEKALETLEQLEGPDDGLKAAIDELLNSDDIAYGMNPDYEKFEGRWMKKLEAMEIKRERFEEAQKAKGLVRCDGKWMTPDEKERYETTPRIRATSGVKKDHISVSISGTDMSGKLVVVCGSNGIPVYPKGDTGPAFRKLHQILNDLGVSTLGIEVEYGHEEFELFVSKREYRDDLCWALTNTVIVSAQPTASCQAC